MAPNAAGTTTDTESDLRRRLAEAEETLRAIREGDVDALVVRGLDQDEVFPLGGHDSYRVFMEAMDIGAAAVDDNGRFVYANGALATLLGQEAAGIPGSELSTILDARSAQIVTHLVADAVDQRRSRQISMVCGSILRHVEVTVAPLSFGFGFGHALTFTDVTERVEAAAADEGERIGRAIMASSNEAVVVCSLGGIITHANPGLRQIHDGRVIGRRFEDAFPMQFGIGSGLIGANDLVDVASAGSVVRGVEATLERDGFVRDLLLSAGPLRQSGQAIGGCIVTLADVTERNEAERRQALMVGELTHRVKNTLTLVLSIANRTIAGAANLKDFKSAFVQRLEALAATQNLLAEGAWRSLTLEELIGAELAPYVSFDSARVIMRGLNMRIEADTAVALGLIFHELVTNAVKYGALSNDDGQVTITAAQGERAVEILWQEDGGPPVSTPTKVGFGQSVISRGLGQRGEMATRVEFRTEGLVCRMFLPEPRGRS